MFRLALTSLALQPAAAQDLFLRPQPTQTFAAANSSLGVGHDRWVFSFALASINNLCLDIAGQGNNGDMLQAWECNGLEGQLWFFDSGAFQIQWAGDSSKCVDAREMSPGNQLILWDCNGASQQRWSYDADMYTVFLADSGAKADASLCMDLAGGDWSSGTPIVAWDCNNLWEQQWWLKAGITIRLGNDNYYCFDLPGGDTNNGNQIWLWECNGGWSQQWEFTDWQIKFASDTSKCIDARGLAAGNQLMLWDCNGWDQQTWGYDSSNGALYLAASAADASFCVDLVGGQNWNGVSLQTWDCSGCWNQGFTVIGPADGQASHLGLAARNSSSLGVAVGDCPPVPGPAPGPTPPSPSAGVLPRCMDGDQYGWPTFDNQAALQASPWGKYFELVYGEIPSTNYPICSYSQILLYKPHLDSAGVTPPVSMKSKCPDGAGQWYNTMTSAGSEASWSNWIWNPNLQMPLAAGSELPGNTWVEVHHKAFGMDGSATWLYYAPGMAVWANLGNTKSYNDHPDATQDIMGQTCGDNECIKMFEDLYTAMRNQGLNTIQFRKHHDMKCGNGATEIVDVAGPGKNPCGQDNSGTGRYKAGWGAAYDCNCNNFVDDKTINCDGFGISNR